MKRYNNLYSKIVDISNLRLAHANSRKGKSSYSDVQLIDDAPDFYLYRIQGMLINKSYKTSPYEVFKRVDRGKEREIFKLPYFPDRIVHWAIVQILEPIWMNVFIHNTYSSIKGRGIHSGLTDLHNSMQDVDGTKYCLKIDVKKFYPSINHSILKVIIRKKIKDNDLLWLLDEIIDSIDGVPIGNYLSQYFGNLYLSYFDHWIKETMKVEYYFRYCDDCIFLHSSKEFLQELNTKIMVYLSTNLSLTVKDNWQVFPTRVRGIDFLGYRSFGKYTLLRKNTFKRMKRKFRVFKKEDKLSEHAVASIMSYKGWLKWCNSYNLNNTLIVPLLSKGVLT